MVMSSRELEDKMLVSLQAVEKQLRVAKAISEAKGLAESEISKPAPSPLTSSPAIQGNSQAPAGQGEAAEPPR